MRRIFLGFMAAVPIAALVALCMRYPNVGLALFAGAAGLLVLYLIGMIVEEIFN